MKNLVSFLAVAMVFFLTVPASATTKNVTTVVQRSVDKKASFAFVGTNVESHNYLVSMQYKDFGFTEHWSCPDAIYRRPEILFDKKIAIPAAPFILDKDVVWLTNFKSK